MKMQRDRHVQAARSPLGAVDALGITLLAISLLTVSLLRSRHRMFWSDEIMGLLVLRAPSIPTAFRLWQHGIDSSGLWFHVFGRVWAAVFGTSEVTLRLYSAAGIAGSAAVLWVAARRYYSALPVAASLWFIYSAVGTVRWQLANGRTYGVFLLACAVVVYLLLRGEDKNQARPTPLFLFATFSGYSLLAGSHVLGLFWVCAFAVVQVALDVRPLFLRSHGDLRRWRPGLYLSAIASLVVVFFSRANLRADTALGKPTFWTRRPDLHDLLTGGKLINIFTLAVLVLLACIAFRSRYLRRERAPIYVLLAGFLGVDLVLFLISWVTTSVYTNRYLLPLSFAVALLFCELFEQLQQAVPAAANLKALLPAAFIVVAVALFFVPRLQRKWLPIPDYTDDLLAMTAPGEAILVPDTGTFVELQFLHHDDRSRRIIYPQEPSIALDPGNLAGASGAHEMDNFKADRIYADDILPSSEALDAALQMGHGFTVIAAPGDLWMQRRIVADSRFVVTDRILFQDASAPLELIKVHVR